MTTTTTHEEFPNVSTEIIQEFDGLPDDLKSVLSKPEVLDAMSKVFEKREAPLKAKRDELLSKISETNEQLKQLGGLDTIKDLAAQAAEAQRKVEEAAAKSTDVETVKRTYADKLAAAEQRHADLLKQVINEKAENLVSKAIREAKGSPELLTPHVQSRIKSEYVDGQVKVTVLGANGVPMLRDDGKEATVKDLIEEFRGSPAYARAFDANGITGSGAKDAKPALNGVINPWLSTSKNLTQQMQIVRENPAMAKSLAAAAGVELKLD
jgi:rubrerythrin